MFPHNNGNVADAVHLACFPEQTVSPAGWYRPGQVRFEGPIRLRSGSLGDPTS